MFVIDSSALLAIAFEEPGWQFVAERLPSSTISTVNWGEVATKMLRDGLEPLNLRDLMGRQQIHVAPLTETQALAAARLAAPNRTLGLSLGDRCCLALAAELGVPALSADRRWASATSDAEVILIR